MIAGKDAQLVENSDELAKARCVSFNGTRPMVLSSCFTFLGAHLGSLDVS